MKKEVDGYENVDVDNDNELDFDELLAKIGQLGRRQLLIIIIALMGGVTSVFHFVVVQYYIEVPKEFYCSTITGSSDVPVVLANPVSDKYKYNTTSTSLMNSSSINNLTIKDQCLHFDEICQSWKAISTNTSLSNTVVTQMGLFCESKWLWAHIKSSFFVFVGIGVAAFGKLSDKIGRRKTLIITTVGSLVSGCAVALSPNIVIFIVFRCMVGLFGIAGYTVGFILAVEIVGSRWRALMMGISSVYCDLIKVSTGVVALLLTDWRWLQLYGSLLDLPILLLIVVFVPESPRWLVTAGRNEEALAIMSDLAKKNGIKLPEKTKLRTHEAPKGRIRDLFSTKSMTLKSLEIMFGWFSISMVFWAIYLNTGKYMEPGWKAQYVLILFATGNIFLCDLLVLPLANSLGRRYLHTITCIIVATCLYIVPFVSGIIVTILGVIGIVSATLAFDAIYIRSGEIFPTSVRNVGFGIASMCGRIGSVIFPYIDLSENSGMLWLPSIIYASLSLLGALVSWHLPETLNKGLPETVADEGDLVLSMAPHKCWSDGHNADLDDTNTKEYPGSPVELVKSDQVLIKR